MAGLQPLGVPRQFHVVRTEDPRRVVLHPLVMEPIQRETTASTDGRRYRKYRNSNLPVTLHVAAVSLARRLVKDLQFGLIES